LEIIMRLTAPRSAVVRPKIEQDPASISIGTKVSRLDVGSDLPAATTTSPMSSLPLSRNRDFRLLQAGRLLSGAGFRA
jgi:hypothetical protein